MPHHNYDSKDKSLVAFNLNTDDSLIGWETRAKPTWLKITLVLYVLIKTKQKHVIGKVTSYETFIVGETFWVKTRIPWNIRMISRNNEGRESK